MEKEKLRRGKKSIGGAKGEGISVPGEEDGSERRGMDGSLFLFQRIETGARIGKLFREGVGIFRDDPS